MGACTSSAVESNSSAEPKKGHKPHQRSLSSSRNIDPSTAKVAVISPRQSIIVEQLPACISAAQPSAACEGGCQCKKVEEEHKEGGGEAARLSSIIVIDSPPANNRQLLLTAADVDGRPANSSHSGDTPATGVGFGTPQLIPHAAHSSFSPSAASDHTDAMPHSVGSVPTSPLIAATPAHQSGTPAALSACSSPSHSCRTAAIRACPVHARSPSLSILQLLQQTNHSRSPSLIFHTDATGMEHMPTLGAQQDEEQELGGGGGQHVRKAASAMEETKEMVEDAPDQPAIYRTQVDTVS